MEKDTDMRMGERKFVDIGGVRTSYFEGGEGRPVVLFAGGGFGTLPRAAHSAFDWDLNFAGLARWCHVFAVDKLGHGFTDAPKRVEDYTRASQIQHGLEFLRTLGLGGATLVGHSQGGALVTRLTLEHPDLVRTCVIVDTGSTLPGVPISLGEHPKPALTRESQRWLMQKYSVTWDHITDALLDGMCEIADQDSYREMVDIIAREDLITRLIAPEMVEESEETHRWLRERRLKTPTLVVWGYNDPTPPLSRGLQLFDLIANSTNQSQMHVFGHAGHFSFREHPQAFNQVLRSFVERND